MRKEASRFCVKFVMCSLTLGALLLSSAPAARAALTQLHIKNCAGATGSPSPAFGGMSFGSVGSYEVICGTFTGAVDPGNPRNAVIVDIANAPRDVNGLVEYTVNFQIIRPANLSNGNGRIIYDMPNRGGAGALSTLNSSPGVPAATNNATASTITTAASAGTGFLMNLGWTIVEVGWDITVPTVTGTSFGVNFPVATNGTNPITGPATEELDVDFTVTQASLPLTYPPVTTNPANANGSLTVRENYEDTPISVPACSASVTVVCWTYITNPLTQTNPGAYTGTAVQLRTNGSLSGSQINFGAAGTYSPTALYEFTYQAMNPVPAGLGFAAIRDLATFLRTATADNNSTPNPLPPPYVQKIYTICSSQPCRTTHDYVLWGFNQNEDGATGSQGTVIDGMLNYLGGGDGIFMNYRFSQPTRTQRQHIARWTPEFQFPFADLTIKDHVTHQTDGRQALCEASNTCPNTFEANSENEWYSKGGSMLTTDGQGHDLDLTQTPNVRYYLLSSFQHGTGNSTSAGICQQLNDPLNSAAVERALLLDLDDWTSNGTPPPANRVPTIADGTLVPSLPLGGQGFPNIPGVSNANISHTGDLFNFGPLFAEGILTVLPPILLDTPYQIFVPETDADGNDLAGVRVPEVAVPLATYAGWNLRAAHSGQPVPIVDGCDAAGQYLPFPASPVAGDPRLSLRQRYMSQADYVNKVTQAAQQLEAEGFLLPEDVALYNTNAGNQEILPSSNYTDGEAGFQFTGAYAAPSPSAALTIGPQAMEGDLKLSPGAMLQVGFDFKMPGNHPAAAVTFFGAQVTFAWTCASGPGGGTLTVPMLSYGYSDPQGSSAWYPTGNQSSPLAYQVSTTVPNNCNGGLVRFQQGGTFSTNVYSTDTQDHMNVRWHYSGGGSAGGWSGTQTVVP